MTRRAISSPTTLGIAAVCVLLGLGGAWAFFWNSEDEPASKTGLPQDLTVKAMRAQAKEDPGKLFEKGRQMREREDLTEEQRREARRNMWRAMMAMMDERVEEYYAAAPEERNAVLDRHLDDWMERMKEWEQRREQWRNRQREERSEEEREQQRRERARRWIGANREERKARSESRDPDAMARRMAYFMAMRNRANERGIDLPGPRGARGGRDGNRDGEGRGRGGGRR